MALNLKGGRGVAAPYKITHQRTPEPLKPLLGRIIAAYKELLEGYEDPEDPLLMAEVLQKITGEVNTEQEGQKQVIKNLINSWNEAQLHAQDLQNQINKLKETKNRDVINKTIIDFINYEKSIYGKSPSQAEKEFSLNTRRWDAFRGFINFVSSPPSVGGWSVGDKCNVIMPLGGILEGCEITRFKADLIHCEVLNKETGSTYTLKIDTLYRA